MKFKIIGYLKGYIMNYLTKEIAEYNPITCPPFYTLVFKKEDFLDPQKHFSLIKNLKSHEDIATHPQFKELEGRGFVVGCHGENISTTYNHRYKGRVLTKEEAEDIMIRTGTLASQPLKFKPSLRLRARIIVNHLPFHSLIKKLYYSLPGKFRII